MAPQFLDHPANDFMPRKNVAVSIQGKVGFYKERNFVKVRISLARIG
jgi:hypothetical protein